MKTYIFRYDNEIKCTCDNQEFINNRALYRLSKLDNINYDSVIIGKNTLKLKADNVEVIIHDLNNFMRTKILDRCFSDTLPIIKKQIKRKQKTHNKTIKNIKMHGKRIVAGSMTLAMLLSIYKLKDLENTKEVLEKQTNENTDNYIKPNNIEEQINDDVKEINPSLELTFENLSDSEKALYVQKKYGDVIDYYSSKWGIDSRIVTAILTQESGGKETNLMQIEFKPWKDQKITSHNFYNDEDVTIVLTDNPELYDDDIICISEVELSNPKTNISVGTIMLAYNLKTYNYNIPIALTSYNCGIGTMEMILDETIKNTDYTRELLINDPTNVEFLDYRYIMTDGDKNYFENVIRYISNSEECLKVSDNNNTIHELGINFNSKTK